MNNALMVVLSAVIVIVMLAILITVHEFGHYIAARLCGIKVREFAIGMGPVIWRRKPKQAALPEQAPSDGVEPQTEGTVFSIRAVPFGGFCDMGEDEESNDPNHFRNKSIWKKILVLVSGSVMNLLIGVVFIVIFALISIGYTNGNSVITGLSDDFPYPEIQVGDRLVKVNNRAIYDNSDVQVFLNRADVPCTLVLERGGQTFEVSGVERTHIDEEGNAKFGISFGGRDEMTAAGIPRLIYTKSVNYVRYVWVGLLDLVTGRSGISQMAGPVGIVNVVTEITTTEAEGVTFKSRVLSILDLTAMIAINLAVVNMLPIPALDGGRILFIFISAFLVLVRKRPLSEKIEGYIHGVTYILLIGLMVLVLFGDIRRWIGF